MIIPLEKEYNTAIVLFPKRSRDVFTLSCIPEAISRVREKCYENKTDSTVDQLCLDSVCYAHNPLGADQRRCDAMFPQPYAIIGNETEKFKITTF